MLICNLLVPKIVLIGGLCAAVSLISGCGGTGQRLGSTAAVSNLSSGTTNTTTPTTVAAAGTTSTPNPTPAPSPAPTPGQFGIPHSSHVILVIEENHTYDEVLSNMPWLVAQGAKYGHATNYHADTAGSLMDYLWLSSGSCHTSSDPGNCNLPTRTGDFGCSGYSCSSPITDDNIFSELGRAGLRWKVYAQSLPSAGYMGDFSGEYVSRHNPAKWYADVINNVGLQRNMVPFTQFADDLAANRLPNYSIIVPDLQNDAHDGTLAQADSFLAGNVAPLLNTPYFHSGGDGLMFVTFDECDAAVGACPENVFTAVIGPKVKPGSVSNAYYKHESTLRTILDALGVNVYPGASATAPDMTDFF